MFKHKWQVLLGSLGPQLTILVLPWLNSLAVILFPPAPCPRSSDPSMVIDCFYGPTLPVMLTMGLGVLLPFMIASLLMAHDAQRRGLAVAWGLLGLVPLIGPLIYTIKWHPAVVQMSASDSHSKSRVLQFIGGFLLTVFGLGFVVWLWESDLLYLLEYPSSESAGTVYYIFVFGICMLLGIRAGATLIFQLHMRRQLRVIALIACFISLFSIFFVRPFYIEFIDLVLLFTGVLYFALSFFGHRE